MGWVTLCLYVRGSSDTEIEGMMMRGRGRLEATKMAGRCRDKCEEMEISREEERNRFCK